MAYDLNTTTLGELMEDPRVIALFDEYAPGMANNPMIAMAKGMNVNQALGMAGGMIPADKMAEIRTKLEAL